MNKVLHDLLFTTASQDDIIIYSKTAEEHLEHLQQVFHKLHDAGLSMKLSKCHFFAKEIQYLGLVLSTTGIKQLPSKTAAIRLMKLPKNAKQVIVFFGLVGYYHKLINNFAWIAKPLTALTSHDMKSDWTSGHHAAFTTLKSALMEVPILHYWDPSKCYTIYTDVSDDACGAQLSQAHNGQELSCISLPHIYRHSMEMEHYRTVSLWCLLCSKKVELLSTWI